MADVPENAPEHCPGTGSEEAGKASACQGCPNQNVCASGIPAQPDPDLDKVRECLSGVRHKVLVLSGKGGVGKSTVTSMLAHGLARDSQLKVAILDVDICGPSIPRVMGVSGEAVHQSGSGWSPIYVEDNLSVMSVGALLSSPDDAVIWRGPKKNGMIKQFLRDVDWGEVDYLLVDTPPGTSDEHLSAVHYLQDAASLDGAVVVTTPQEVALLDVRKEIGFCRRLGVPILGVVENMSSFSCPACHKESLIFPTCGGGVSSMCREMGVELLCSLPLDPSLGQSCDGGLNYLEHAHTPTALAFLTLSQRIRSICEKEDLKYATESDP